MVRKKGASLIPGMIIGFLCVACVLPFLLLLMSSVTDETSLVANGYSLIPQKFSFLAYRYVFSGSVGKILTGYRISISVTFIGTALSLILTSLLAYPLSNPRLPGRGFFLFIVLFTMLFNGGVVSSYMMWTQMFNIKNTMAALIFPNLLMNAFSVILMRSYFVSSIPSEIYEAARLDGAGEFGMYWCIALPLSKPMLATLGFMTALGYWNDWTNGLYYLTDTNKYGIQNILNSMLNDATFLSTSEGARFAQMTGVTAPSVSTRMAVAVLGIVPVLIVFPFFQKYFVSGITLGGVKG